MWLQSVWAVGETRAALTGSRRAAALRGTMRPSARRVVMLTRSGSPGGRLAPCQPQAHVPAPLGREGAVRLGVQRAFPLPRAVGQQWGGSRHLPPPTDVWLPSGLAAPARSFPLTPRHGAQAANRAQEATAGTQAARPRQWVCHPGAFPPGPWQGAGASAAAQGRAPPGPSGDARARMSRQLPTGSIPGLKPDAKLWWKEAAEIPARDLL